MKPEINGTDVFTFTITQMEPICSFSFSLMLFLYYDALVLMISRVNIMNLRGCKLMIMNPDKSLCSLSIICPHVNRNETG